ncbi:MAG: SprB repeat-containing protein [Bacteroidia bacterium]|nr:SprB repeat-containing protein [Bacteroidia bacterium]
MITGFIAQGQIQATLTAANYNGYNISCFGMQDGSLTANVSAGIPPFTFRWSNGAITASVNGLSAGYYSVNIVDSTGADTTLQVTLLQPEPLTVQELIPYVYAKGAGIVRGISKKPQWQIDVSGVPDGIYFIRISTSSTSVLTPVVINK